MRSNPYGVAILVMVLLVLFMYKRNELPTIFFNETNTATGTIINTKYLSGRNGYIQRITYAYPTEQGVISASTRIKGNTRIKRAGDHVNITYDIDNPYKHEINGYLASAEPALTYRLFSYKHVGYKQIVLRGEFIYVRDFYQHEKLASETIGTFTIKNDTLTVIPIIEKDIPPSSPQHFLFKVIDQKDTVITDLQTKDIYQ